MRGVAAVLLSRIVLTGALAVGAPLNAAGEPPAQAPAASPQQAAPAAAARPGTRVLVDDTVSDAQLRQILAKGYRPEHQAHGNEVYYCRRESELGSRFGTKVCRTAARILQEEQQGKEATTVVQQTPGTRAGK